MDQGLAHSVASHLLQSSAQPEDHGPRSLAVLDGSEVEQLGPMRDRAFFRRSGEGTLVLLAVSPSVHTFVPEAQILRARLYENFCPGSVRGVAHARDGEG